MRILLSSRISTLSYDAHAHSSASRFLQGIRNSPDFNGFCLSMLKSLYTHIINNLMTIKGYKNNILFTEVYLQVMKTVSICSKRDY